MRIRNFESDDEADVIGLWHCTGVSRPWNDPERDIKRCLAVEDSWLLVGEVSDQIVASVMVGYDGHRGWIYYLAVHPDYQKQGLGRQLMNDAERILREAGCAKLNLQVRYDNQEVERFYERLGYRQDQVISFGKRLDR